MITDHIVVERHSGPRAPDLLLGRTSAKSHNGAAILLAFRPFDVKYMADVIDTDDVRQIACPVSVSTSTSMK